MSTIHHKAGARPWRCGKETYFRLAKLGFFRGQPTMVQLIKQG